MARSFSSTEAKLLIEKHTSLISKLTNASNLDKKYRDNIKNASDRLAVQEILTVLRGIPVEELNREKRGVKTKTLRDHHYCNMADLHTANVYQIASIKGISQDSAYTIKRMVNSFVEQTRKEVKIKLSADNRNQAATELVRAISIYRGSKRSIEACTKRRIDWFTVTFWSICCYTLRSQKNRQTLIQMKMSFAELAAQSALFAI